MQHIYCLEVNGHPHLTIIIFRQHFKPLFITPSTKIQSFTSFHSFTSSSTFLLPPPFPTWNMFRSSDASWCSKVVASMVSASVIFDSFAGACAIDDLPPWCKSRPYRRLTTPHASVTCKVPISCVGSSGSDLTGDDKVKV